MTSLCGWALKKAEYVLKSLSQKSRNSGCILPVAQRTMAWARGANPVHFLTGPPLDAALG
ncbi:hypothetical protein A2U01_0060842, partial [Trifolium medium]|nr:hypothetical protein [Trifolium medium]